MEMEWHLQCYLMLMAYIVTRIEAIYASSNVHANNEAIFGKDAHDPEMQRSLERRWHLFHTSLAKDSMQVLVTQRITRAQSKCELQPVHIILQTCSVASCGGPWRPKVRTGGQDEPLPKWDRCFEWSNSKSSLPGNPVSGPINH